MRSDTHITKATTRKDLASQDKLHTRKKSQRVGIIAGAFLAIAGLVTGGSIAVQSAQSAEATQTSVAATTALAESTGLDQPQLAVYRGIAKAHTDNEASIVLVSANQVIAAAHNKVDASTLTSAASSLASYEVMPLEQTVRLTARTRAEIAAVTAATAASDRAVAKAAAVKKAAVVKRAAAVKKAAAVKAVAVKKAAVARAAAARAVAARKAAAQAAAKASLVVSRVGSNTIPGARATARSMAAARFGWGSGQFSCLSQLWQKESGWNYRAYNRSGGATGIPQALPGSKMASAGSDWRTNAATQIRWGLTYIKSSYGTPCSAWAHSRALNWY
jgi:hypothetical protein